MIPDNHDRLTPRNEGDWSWLWDHDRRIWKTYQTPHSAQGDESSFRALQARSRKQASFIALTRATNHNTMESTPFIPCWSLEVHAEVSQKNILPMTCTAYPRQVKKLSTWHSLALMPNKLYKRLLIQEWRLGSSIYVKLEFSASRTIRIWI